MSSQAPAECRVSGALGCALRMSRVAGVAPLSFRRLRTGWRARVSPAANVYGGILAVTMCALTLIAFLMDFYMVLKISVDTGTRNRSAVYFAELSFMMLVVLTSTFTGSMRMKNMMVYLNQIHKINLELRNYGCTPSDDKKCWLLLILSFVGGLFTMPLKSGVFIYLIKLHHGTVLVSMIYGFYLFLFFVIYLVLLTIPIQFVLLNMAALSPLKQINGCLNELLQEISSQENTRHILQKKRKINNFILLTSDLIKPSINLRSNIPEAIHHVARQHSYVCNVVRLVDKSHGPILLTLLLFYLLHLVISLYFIINFFLIEEETSYFSIVSQSIWGTFYVSSLILIVEPCHQTQEMMANTREIVSKMTQQVQSPEDPLSIELELFYRHLVLNQVTYSPLKMFTINRALVITMLSAITTYLVIVIKL